MTRWVEIVSIACRSSVACFAPPLDASREEADLYRRLREAAQNTASTTAYYLHGGKCVFHLTITSRLGLLNFRFQWRGVDRRARHEHARVRLGGTGGRCLRVAGCLGGGLGFAAVGPPGPEG